MMDVSRTRHFSFEESTKSSVQKENFRNKDTSSTPAKNTTTTSRQMQVLA